MLKENINWPEYKDRSIDFILIQATKLLEESIKAYRETTNKCYVAFTFYVSIIAYCLNKILSANIDLAIIPYAICLIGSSICIFILYETLKPAEITFPGACPEKLLIEDFEGFEEKEQERYYKENFIELYNRYIDDNFLFVRCMSKKFINSINVLIATFFLSGFIWLFLFLVVKCQFSCP